MKKKVTFADLARRTGFSKTTISRYFNHVDSLSLETQQLIQKAVEDLGYSENKLARVLANGKTEIVGVVVPTLYMQYHADLLAKLLAAGDDYGYKFIVFISNEDREAEKRYLSELMAYKVEGLIMTSHATPSQELAALNLPVVTIEREDQYVNSVNTNNYQGGLTATRHLVQIGCEVLIHINGDLLTTSPAYGRIRGFREIAESSGLEKLEYLQRLGIQYDDIREQMIPIFADIEKTCAGKKKGIFVSNDTSANVLLNLILQKYGSLPDDYKLIGFDDSPISWEAAVPFSTIRQDTRAIADDAMELLVHMMDGRKQRIPVISKALVHHVIDTELIVRTTTVGRK